MLKPCELSIADAVRLMRNGELKARELMESCLERIQLRDKSIHAWVEVYEKEAFSEADDCDRAFNSGELKGSLHGIPVGVKDIIDVKGMWTRAGCPVYKPRIADVDNPAVELIRDAGAIIIGKTETTAFANDDPAATRNPWNLNHTPGGSSSGSGAAVADRMCLAALGTQTGGSVLRPAAYNGIVGFKPSIAAINTKNVVPVSWTLDHIGLHTRNVQDAELVFNILRDDCPDPFAHTLVCPQKESSQTVHPPFRFGYLRKFVEKEASSEILDNFESVIKLLEKQGSVVLDVEFTDAALQALSVHSTIFYTEQASYHRGEFESYKNLYPPKLKAHIEHGMKTMGYEYINALRERIVFQNNLFSVLSEVDALILPTAPTTAPMGLESTGSPVFCEPFSLAGFPSITLPSALDDVGLPLSVQIGSRPDEEKNLLSIAAWFEALLSFNFNPVDSSLK